MNIRQLRFRMMVLAGLGVVIVGCGGSGSGGGGTGNVTTKFIQTNLVADTTGAAAVTDPHLVNPWGMSFSPTGTFWVSDNKTGLSTLYNGVGAIQSLVVQIPAAGGGMNGPVSGQVYNGTSDFVIPNSAQSVFIFDSEDGIISAWYAGSSAVTVADRSASGAVYKGLAMGVNAGANFLYAANFNGNAIDMFDGTFTFVKSFTDPNIPSGFAPFGIQNINGLLYVTFAMQDGAKHNSVAGAGFGYVDVFNTDGTLSKRLISQGALNSPWGLALAPTSFGAFGGALLVGNFGDGHINAYSASSGALLGAVNNSAGQPIAIPGLWGLLFGNGGQGGSLGTLYFTSGPGQETHGLFGSLAPTQ